MHPSRPISRALFLALFAALAGCASTGGKRSPAAGVPLSAALASFGAATYVEGTGLTTQEVVLLKDRHAVGAGIFLVEEDLRNFQREQHAVIANLVDRGYTLLGCEHTLGPIPRNKAAEDHLEIIQRARAENEDLNQWSVYQPLRYEIEFAGRLTVLGVEDAALYEQDVDTLGKIEKVRQVQRFASPGGRQSQMLQKEEARLLALIRANVSARGAAAARHLLAAMKERGDQKAILMLGASHIPAASAELKSAGLGHWVFEAPSFKRKAE